VAGIERRAEVTWEGGLADGRGTASAGTGVFDELPVSWPARVERPDGQTSPEELLAASHAACYAMALSHVLGQAGTPPERLDVSAVVSAELGEGGLRVTGSALEVVGRVPGVDGEGFTSAAEEAERNCPISNALRGNLEIRVQARLESEGGANA
jgi:lipoyl-dependent peroxiredoxin